MTDWQPIETAPRDGTGVLLFMPAHHDLPVMSGKFDWEWVDSAGDYSLEPTHWMPLPEPPCQR